MSATSSLTSDPPEDAASSGPGVSIASAPGAQAPASAAPDTLPALQPDESSAQASPGTPGNASPQDASGGVSARGPLGTQSEAGAPRRPGRPAGGHAPRGAPAAALPGESGFPWERSPLAGIPSTRILAELQRRRERSAQLLAEHARILEQMQAIEKQLQLIGHDVEARTLASVGEAPRASAGRRSKATGRTSPAGNARSKRGRRASRGAASASPGAASGSRSASPSRGANASTGPSLRQAIGDAVEPRALVTPAELAELLKRNGYVTRAANFGMLVANALAKDGRFRRLGRGSYERIG
jgi:hypothetical protein